MTKNFQKLLLTSTALTLSFNLAICTPVHAENGGDGDEVIENSSETILVDENGKRIITKGTNSGKDGVQVDAIEARVENQGNLTGLGDTTGSSAVPNGAGIRLGDARGTEIINTGTGTITGTAFGIKGSVGESSAGGLEDGSSNTFVKNEGTIIGETNDGVHLMGGGLIYNYGHIEGHRQAGSEDSSAGDGVSIMSFDSTREFDREEGVGEVWNKPDGTISADRYGVLIKGGGSVFNFGTIEGVKGGIVIRGGELENQHFMNAHVDNDDSGVIRQNWTDGDPALFENDNGAAITMAGSADNPLGHVSLKNEGLIEGFAGVRIQADAMHIWNFGQIIANGTSENGGSGAIQIAANGTHDLQKIWIKNGENGEILGGDAQGIVTYGIMHSDGSSENGDVEDDFDQGLTVFSLDNRGLIKGTNAVNVAGMAFIENEGIIKGTDGAGIILRPGASLFPEPVDHNHGHGYDEEEELEQEDDDDDEENSQSADGHIEGHEDEDSPSDETEEDHAEEANKDGWDEDSEASGEEDEDEVTKPEENEGLNDINLKEEKHSDRHRLNHQRRASQILNKESGLIQGTSVGIMVGDNARIANKGDIIGGDAGIAFINTFRDVDEVVVGIANKGTIHGDVVGIYARAGSRDEFRHGEEGIETQTAEDGPVVDAYLFIANAGTIAGDTAIQVDSTAETGLIHTRIINEGQILGDITLGAGNDRVLNAGTINGDINLGAGDDIFKMIGNGTASGTVDGGEGIDLFILAHFEGDFDWDTFAINFEQIETNGDVVFNSGVDVRKHHAMIVNSNVYGDFRIAKFGKLKGSGTIHGHVNNQGITAPGNSIGTLTIQGDYSQTSDGAYELEVGGNASDVLNISGSATLAGGLDVVMDYTDSVLPGSSYTFLTAQSITGSMAVNSNDPFFNVSVQTTSGAMQIRLDRSNYLAPLVNTQRGALAGFVNASAMTTSSVGVSGAMIVPVTTAHSAMVAGVGDAADATQENAPTDKTGWTYSFWSYGQSSEMSNAASGAFSTRGVMTVSAMRVSDTVQYGFAAGGAKSYLSNNGVGSSIGIGRHKSVDMATFASYAKGMAFVVGTVTVNSDQFDEERYLANFSGTIAQAQSRSKAFSTGVSLEGRLKLNWGGIGILPIGRIHYMNMAMGEVTEHGAGIANMVLPSHTVNSLKTSFGLRMNKQFNTRGGMKIIPTLEAFYDLEHGDTSKLMMAYYVSDPDVTVPVLSVLQSKNVGRINAGILTKITNNLGLSFKYQARFADFDSQQMLSAGLKFTW